MLNNSNNTYKISLSNESDNAHKTNTTSKSGKMLKKQSGMTFIGMVIVVAAIVMFGIIGLKVVPAYLEFMNIKNAVKKISNDGAFSSMSKKDISDAFDKSAQIDDFTSVTGKDLVLAKTDAGNVVSVEYQKLIPIFANASILLDFNATTAK